MQYDPGCPLAPIHRTLNDAHTLLHKLEEYYFEPENFRMYLNLVLQTLRNVTFILQSNKSIIPDFDAWYAPWQQLMRDTPILRWVVESRNQVVKQGDLETYSRANIAVVDSYFAPKSIDVDVPPSSTAEEVATAAQAALSIPDEEKDITLVRVERMWIDSALPEYELLDALHYALVSLGAVLDSAHVKLRATETSDAAAFSVFSPVSKEVRTAYLRLKDSTFATRGEKVIPFDDESGKKAAERYDVTSSALKSLPSTLHEAAAQLFEVARKVFCKDGYHRHFVMLIGPGGLKLIELAAEDKADKLLLWRRVAEQVEESKSTQLIVIGEVWQTIWDGKTLVTDVEKIQDKKEFLTLQGASIEGDFVGFRAEICRDTGDMPYLGPTKEDANDIASANFLAPVVAVWNKMRE